MYCVKFLDPLRGRLGFFTEGNSEGFREKAKAAKILADTVWIFYRRQRRERRFSQRQRTKSLFSLLSSVRKDSAIGGVRFFSKKPPRS